MRILTTTPILTGEITTNEFLGCAWTREARKISRRRENRSAKDNGDDGTNNAALTGLTLILSGVIIASLVALSLSGF